MEKQYLTATDLMNYSYCPRIIYYVHVLRSPQFTTKKELKGREKETEFKNKSKRTKVVKDYPKLPKQFRVSLVSENFGIKTIADAVMFDSDKGEAYPIQAKYSFKPDKIYKSQRNQLLMEALLIEESLGYRVPFGFIKFLKSGDLTKVLLNDKMIVLGLFGKIREIIGKEAFPKPTIYKRRCVDCCYGKSCWGEKYEGS